MMADVNKIGGLIEVLSGHLGYTYSEITGKHGDAALSVSRQVVWVRLNELKYPMRAIAQEFGRKHPTIVAGCRRARGLLSTNDNAACAAFDRSAHAEQDIKTILNS